MEQLKHFPGYIARLAGSVLIAILVGTLLLSAACMLPSSPMEKNLERSAAVFAEEGIYPELFPWCTSQLDSTTDALILMISGYDSGENPLIQAMSGTRGTVSTVEAASDELAAHYGEGVPFDGSDPYYQYWHGYQLIIRPLLSLFSYPVIRLLNGLVQTGLLLVLCLLLQRSHLGAYILPWLCTVLLLMPVALAKSLQFSSCYYILTLGSIAIVRKQKSLDRLDGMLFLCIGIATAFFDFLTYPIATLGIPAVFYFCIRRESSVRDTFCRGVKICFSWAVGYGGMWSGKWLIGSLILRQNILSLAAGKLTERSASGTAEASLLHSARAALSANLKSFFHSPASIAVAVLAAVLLFLLAKRLLQKELGVAGVARVLFPFVILALLPVAWYVVLAQHSVIHHWFTNKALCVFVFAALAGLTKALRKC